MKKISRRKLIKDSAKGAVAISSSGIIASCSFFGGKGDETKIPRRILGKTGIEVSILSFGGGSQFAINEDGVWQKLMEKALQNGINCWKKTSGWQNCQY